MSAFSLNKSHFKIIGWTSTIASFLGILFLQIPGIFWFAMIASLTAQTIVKLKRLRINFEIAFGVGFITLITIYIVFLALWMITQGELDHLDSYSGLLAVFFIIGFFQQLITATIFIWIGNK